MSEPIFFKKSELKNMINQASIGFSKINELDIKDLFSASPPTIFIGSKLKYPEVNVGILSPPEHTDNAWLYDSYQTWIKSGFSVKDIVNVRSALINSRFKSDVKAIKNAPKLLENAQEIGLSSKDVDIEIKLNKKPKIKSVLDNIHSPVGAGVGLEKVRITENIKIPQQVDKVINDTDLKARFGIKHLYEKGFEETKISQILSVGALGVKKNRILVPTRWSITATDDLIGKEIIKEIKDYSIVNEYYLFTGHYLGNYYFIMLFPEVWSYELYEGYMPGAAWSPSKDNIYFATDYESYEGRKTYASNTVGGYYAARLPILRYLKDKKRQASVLVVRFETPEYSDPLGVWVVRTAGKKSMDNSPEKFDSKELMLKKVKDLIFKQFRYDVDKLFKKSFLLKRINTQRKLFQY
jgi:DNA repair protein NreA